MTLWFVGIQLHVYAWVLAGDIGYYDEQGYIFVVDRKKELIKYNAFQVKGEEVEFDLPCLL